MTQVYIGGTCPMEIGVHNSAYSYVSTIVCPNISILDTVKQNQQNICIPVIKVCEPKTWAVYSIPDLQVQTIVVKILEFISRDGKKTNSLFKKVVDAGGLNAYLKYKGQVILSPIMFDGTCSGLNIELLKTVIAGLKPAGFLTPDDATYISRPAQAEENIERLLEITRELVDAFPDHIIYGLVKGATVEQNLTHVQKLSELGIRTFVIHTGDYLCKASILEIRKCLEYARAIRSHVPKLLLYGIGAKKYMKMFSFADGIITQNHYVEPFNGVFTNDGITYRSQKATVHEEDIQQTFRRIVTDWINRMTLPKAQTSLDEWLPTDMDFDMVKQHCNSVCARCY